MRLYDAYEVFKVARAVSDLTWLLGFKLGKRKQAKQAAKAHKKYIKVVKRTPVPRPRGRTE